MEKINDAVSWYQHKIGMYDKQLWERSVEKKVIKSIHSIPKKTVKNKPELIDVDLVRGSTFPKAKPKYGWLSVTRRGIQRVVLFPFYYRWWQRQTNTICTVVLFMLYCMQLITLAIYCRDLEDRLSLEVISACHVVTPVVMMLLLGLIHAHIVATQESYRPRHDKDKVRNKSERPKSRKAKSTSSASGQSEAETRSHDLGCNTCTEATNCLRQRKFSSKSILNRRRSTSAANGGMLLSGPKMMDKSDEADDESDDDPGYSKVGEAVLNVRQATFEAVSCDADMQDDAAAKDNVQEDDAYDVLSLDTQESRQENGTFRNGCTKINPAHYRNNDEENVVVDEVAPCSFDNGDLYESFTEVTGEIISQSDTQGQNNKCTSSFDGAECLSGNDAVRETDKDSGVTTKNDTDSNSEVSHVLEGAPYEALGGHACRWGSIVQDVNDLSELTSSGSAVKHKVRCPEKASQTKFGEPNSTCPAGNLRKPTSLNLRCNQLKEECIGVSSCDSEGEATTPQTPKLLSSEMEWVGNTEMTSCGDTSSNTASESELSDNNLAGDNSDKDNNAIPHIASVINNLASGSDKVSCMIWEGEEVKKIDLTVLDIGWIIIRKVDKIPETCDYLLLGFIFTLMVSTMPCAFRLYQSMDKLEPVDPLAITPEHIQKAKTLVFGQYWCETVLVINGVIQRCIMGFLFFFLLSVAERTFKQRLLYAKHFCYLTSWRRAKKYDIPHFRLNKVRNIKTWFSLRSYLKKRGPQRSVDTIVSAAFILEVVLISVMCFQLLQGSETFLEHLGNWELVMWCMALAIYLLHFMTLGTKINKKYRNFSVLITEQINLYLQMEQKPHKKNELMMANSVLKLAEALLKELEIPFKISGLSANPFLYNITKVILLSAFSAVLTELFGFKLKLYKIKLRA